VADNLEVRKQVDFIKTSKDKLKLAQSEELVRRKSQEAPMAQFDRKFNKRQPFPKPC
jgi:hypothetical protein